jgi:hypothetical protein
LPPPPHRNADGRISNSNSCSISSLRFFATPHVAVTFPTPPFKCRRENLTMKVKHELRWIPPALAGDKLTQSKHGSPLNNREGRELRWVPPALSSQRHRIQGFNLSYSPSKKTFLREEEHVDLTSRNRFLLPRRLNESKGIVAHHQSGASSNSSSPYMKGCQTVEKLIQLATSQGDLSPSQLATF